MKSLTSKLPKAIVTELPFMGISPVLPAIALMHLTAWLRDESPELPAGKQSAQPNQSVRLDVYFAVAG